MKASTSRTLLRLTLFAVALGLAVWLVTLVRAKRYRPMELIDWKERDRNIEERGKEVLQAMESRSYKLGFAAGQESFERGIPPLTDEELKQATLKWFAPNGIINPVHLGAYERGVIKGFREGYRAP